MEMARAHLLVSGRVQGVCYRAFTADLALDLGLTGWVRNTPEGRVEAVMEGPRQSIEHAIATCKQGPPAAIVKSIQVDWQPPTGEFPSFQIRH